MDITFIVSESGSVSTLISEPGQSPIQLKTEEVTDWIIQEPIRLLTFLPELTQQQRRMILFTFSCLGGQSRKTPVVDDSAYSSIRFTWLVSEIVDEDQQAMASPGFVEALASSLVSICLQTPKAGFHSTGDHLGMSVFTRCVYESIASQQIVVWLSPDLIPCFLALGRSFGVDQLHQALKLNSPYAQLLYGRSCRMTPGESWEITFADLRVLLDCEHKATYAIFSQFKRAILDPAIKELADHAQLIVTYQEQRVGKRVSSLTFQAV